jgi:hypothetical protein
MTAIPRPVPAQAQPNGSSCLDFEDIFAKDESIRGRLNAIVDAVTPNEISVQTDFTADADGDQRRFITSEARTIRLLAPAGSGKTQSIVNRVLRNVALGHSLGRFLVLTFDNAACLSLKEKLEKGLSQSGASPRGPGIERAA